MPITYSVCLQKNIEKEDYIVCVKNIDNWNEAVEHANKEKQIVDFCLFFFSSIFIKDKTSNIYLNKNPSSIFFIDLFKYKKINDY
jgi:hypothetical protein